ncbi:hypothetical protein [Azospirillum brasilense]|uniref:hypothetical protein n=1 Tax=Azospirillum brasilense TaxID=192 RepID=UPI0011A49F31|nr:hypothetical protein [Azospirillum brasilense]
MTALVNVDARMVGARLDAEHHWFSNCLRITLKLQKLTDSIGKLTGPAKREIFRLALTISGCSIALAAEKRCVIVWKRL